MVRRGVSLGVEQQVVVGGAAAARRGEAAAELHPLDAGDGEEQVGGHPFDRVEEGLAVAGWNAPHAAGNHTAQRIALGGGVAQQLLEAGGVVASAHLGQPRLEAHFAGQHPLGYDPRGNERQREPPREVASAARVVVAVVLDPRRAVGVRGSEARTGGGVVRRAGVRIVEQQRERRPGRMAAVEPRDDARGVLFAAGRGPRRARAAPCQVRLELLGRERNACRHAVERDAEQAAVGFAPERESEVSAEGIHGNGGSLFCCFRCHRTRSRLSSSKKSG